jgi:hypothetical protein
VGATSTGVPESVAYVVHDANGGADDFAERYLHNGDCVVCPRLRAAHWKKTAKGRAYQTEYHRMRERRRKYWNERYKRRAQQRAERAAKDSS